MAPHHQLKTFGALSNMAAIFITMVTPSQTLYIRSFKLSSQVVFKFFFFQKMINSRRIYYTTEAEAHKDRKIDVFPRAFSDKTPYKQNDFSPNVKSACLTYLPIMTGMKMCKVIVLGDISVGKTSLVNRFCHQVFNYNYKATIGVDFEVESFDVLKVPFTLQIWDTAGQERFKCIAAAYYRSAHAIVTVFDLASTKSLHHCPVWLNEAMDSNIETPLKFLVGAKKDLLVNSVYSEVEKRALETAKMMGAEYWAVSARTGENVRDLFYRIAALSFEKVIKSELESVDGDKKCKLGQSLIHISAKQEKSKKKFNCEAGFHRCK